MSPLRTMFCLVSITPITQGSLSYKTTPADSLFLIGRTKQKPSRASSTL